MSGLTTQILLEIETIFFSIFLFFQEKLCPLPHIPLLLTSPHKEDV